MFGRVKGCLVWCFKSQSNESLYWNNHLVCLIFRLVQSGSENIPKTEISKATFGLKGFS